ncbi:c-type cytochrome biogenesis protein CcmI [Cognatishimia sp. F0-27]|uniref:c-type cytochrome biogenesis protein CcmI n=1 Tax=Cognatishimia sp. F0-27 TaxID=2816855 RepID=UPI001D0C6025|nr:c-type cytochrome biogenesis protein CcmI [Cognatishimia sp. F0-27]MCC1494916.1 c-type cytochrome biogenesis protein CcmI [Cognatishimia sp. F0-27]
MTLFWIFTALMGLGVAALLALAVLRGQRDTGPSAAFDVQVYRDQLKEIDRDLTRGTIPPEEADRLRTEVSRRILAADAKARGETPGTAARAPGALILSAVVAAVVIGGGYLTYMQLGAPGYPDLPLNTRIEMAAEARENRPSQADAESGLPATAMPDDVPESYQELVVRLRGAVAENPNDLQGQRLLARSEAALGNFSAAWQAQQAIVRIKAAEATARDYADLADMMILAAGGYVSPEAQAALEEALARDPQNGVARYYGGLMMAQTGRPDVAFRMWDRLLAESPDDAPWIPPIRDQIEEMAFRAGVSNFTLPPLGQRGPTQADIDAAGAMSAEERNDMIRGMVAGLSDRLATEGGPPDDWARLINALSVLGDTDQAQAIYREARMVFADLPDGLQTVDAAAAAANIALPAPSTDTQGE